MFHEGTLQSGIGLAIQEQKLVACFVRDGGDESSTWENDWLQSGWVSSLLAQRAVLLRLEAGSTEAGFLSAFCPLSNIPTFVVIQNGQLQEQIVSGASKDEFINRIRKVLGASEIPGVSQTPSSAVYNTQAPPAPEPVQTSPDEPSQDSEPRPPVSPILPPSTKAKGKRRVDPPDPKADLAATNAAQTSAREALRKKKQEEKDELARIQARIEADKAERKAQANARKADRERSKQAQTPPQTLTPSKKSSHSQTVHLNIRLFDGRTIRHIFPRDSSLQHAVRPWIDQEFSNSPDDSKQKLPPYYFKQIQAPLPSRELSAGEESAALGDIELAPSATLVLVPVKGYTEAYMGGEVGVVGGLVGVVGGAVGIARAVGGYVGSTLGSMVGYGSSSAEPAAERASGGGHRLSGGGGAREGMREEEAGSAGAGAGAAAAGIRVRTLADQRERDEGERREFYNGNQLSFQPNEDEDESRR
ncbi:hypothetical protein EJ04DRAFT_472709 [Polyplosphaeria fusca]|uniref:UBX domain-containing protein 2 n=1 Tax=Polyplosphaeria fusca TaxID=682080 RepID=A0A9P4QU87_9PLEO|nr:hypothetical protein EJ04DRAFT_472709 [Polyplosphaeria fusca]